MLTEQVIATLESISDGWGGETTKKPTTVAITKANQILTELESCKMPYPNIQASTDGSIVMMWDTSVREITVTIDPVGDVAFLTSIRKFSSSGDEIDRLDAEGYVTDISVIGHMMAWLVSDYAAEA